MNTVIRLLVRTKTLYSFLFDLRKILVLIFKQYEMFHHETGKYKKFLNSKNFTKDDEKEVIKAIKELEQGSRRVVHLMDEYKLFK